jgi:hypothetical protein
LWSGPAETSAPSVQSDPAGTEVEIDQRLDGQPAVARWRLPPGRYSRGIAEPVLETAANQAVNVVADSAAVAEIRPREQFGTITVESVPAGAEVLFTTTIGKTPLTDDQIVPGAYTVELRHPDDRYRTERVSNVVVHGNGSVAISKQLDKRRLFDQTAVLRLGLGLVCVGGGIIGGIGASRDNVAQTVVGYLVGTVGLVGVEIVAFF